MRTQQGSLFESHGALIVTVNTAKRNPIAHRLASVARDTPRGVRWLAERTSTSTASTGSASPLKRESALLILWRKPLFPRLRRMWLGAP